MKTVFRFKNVDAKLDVEVIQTDKKFDCCETVLLTITDAPDGLAANDTITLGIFVESEFGSLRGSHWDAPNQARIMNCLVSEKQFSALKQDAKPIPDKTLKGKTLDWELPEQNWR